MRKLYIFGLIGLVLVIIGLAFADQMTLSTYYPAPYGVYRVLRLGPSIRPQTGDEGDLYYDNGQPDASWQTHDTR